MKRPNPLPACHMTPAERRLALCRILALGLIRLHMRKCDQVSDQNEEVSLHFPPDQSGHATPNKETTS